MLELLQLIIPVVLLAVGFFVGRVLERKHYVSIRQRERNLQSVVALTTRFPPPCVHIETADLVAGSVVISSDYFKSFVAGFRNLVGGRFRGFESLMERARREALLRLKAQAQAQGSSLVLGVRFHTTQVAGSTTPSMEVMAYGTAVKGPRTTGPTDGSSGSSGGGASGGSVITHLSHKAPV
jgi:uncharacterized protein YbjQ (UPF0145 family)